MKKNLDQYLLKFLRNEGDLFIDEFYGDSHIIRFYLIDKILYVVTRIPEIKCCLGSFERYDQSTFRLHYDFDVYCLVTNKSSKNDRINIINNLYPETDIKGRLLEYLKLKDFS